jgi:signal peptidase II
MMARTNRWWPLLWAALVLGLDRWTKVLVDAWAESARSASPFAVPSLPILGDTLRLSYVRNPGMIFGFLAHSDLPGRDAVLTAASLVAIVLLGVYYFRLPAEKRALRFGLGLVLGGALGNLIDRMLYGYVIDFIDVSLYFARWPAFNLADSAIVVGVALMSVDLVFHVEPEPAGERGGS